MGTVAHRLCPLSSPGKMPQPYEGLTVGSTSANFSPSQSCVDGAHNVLACKWLNDVDRPHFLGTHHMSHVVGLEHKWQWCKATSMRD
eukprot:jgi/Botrbrau1/1606/Bobra.0185s0021.1